MNKAFMCRRLMFGAAGTALLALHRSQSEMHMACARECLITRPLVGKMLHTLKVGHGRLVVNRLILLQLF